MLRSSRRIVGGHFRLFAASLLAACFAAAPVAAQDDDEQIEEITVTGSQIKGAAISGALPVSIVSVADIEAFGIDSGDELLDLMPGSSHAVIMAWKPLGERQAPGRDSRASRVSTA